MFTDFPRYTSYLHAGDWLQTIPSTWSWSPARIIFVERKETGFVGEQLLSVTISRGVIPQASLLSSSSKKDSSNLDKSKYKLVCPGDVVYNKMRAWQGAAGSSFDRGIVSPAYVVMTPRSGMSEYFHHVVRTPMFSKEAERWSYGITSDQWSLRPEHFKMIRLPVPPADDQAAIVKYLTHANARIDKAIANKRRLMNLLEEQRTVVLEELLQEISIGSQMPMLRHALCWIEQGISPSVFEGNLDEGQWAVLSLSAVNRGAFVAEALKPVNPSVEWPEALELHHGDLLMTRSNTRERVGDVAVVRGVRAKTFMSDLIYRLVLRDDRLLSEFASLVLRSQRIRVDIQRLARGSSGTMPKLAQGHIKALRVPMPDMEVQIRCVEHSEVVAKPIVDALARTKYEIELLQEFRTRLVADVVTGQVDVRSIAATLPDAPEEILDLTGDSDDDLEEIMEDQSE